MSVDTRDGSRRKRTPPRSLHVLTFPPGTIFGFHTTPQGMECHHSSGAKHRARSRDDFRVGTCIPFASVASITHAALIPRWFPHSNLKLLRSNRKRRLMALLCEVVSTSR
jgi:hypothetical protein